MSNDMWNRTPVQMYTAEVNQTSRMMGYSLLSLSLPLSADYLVVKGWWDGSMHLFAFILLALFMLVITVIWIGLIGLTLYNLKGQAGRNYEIRKQGLQPDKH